MNDDFFDDDEPDGFFTTEDLLTEEQLAEIYRVVMEDDMSAPLTVEEFKIVMESWTQTKH